MLGSLKTESESSSEGCSNGFHRLGNGCYFYAYFRLNWFRAMEFCHSFGAGISLAAIESWEENEEIKLWLKDNGINFEIFSKLHHMLFTTYKINSRRLGLRRINKIQGIFRAFITLFLQPWTNLGQ